MQEKHSQRKGEHATAVHVWKPSKTKSVTREHQTTGG